MPNHEITSLSQTLTVKLVGAVPLTSPVITPLGKLINRDSNAALLHTSWLGTNTPTHSLDLLTHLCAQLDLWPTARHSYPSFEVINTHAHTHTYIHQPTFNT
jgi:hypothetical protein